MRRGSVNTLRWKLARCIMLRWALLTHRHPDDDRDHVAKRQRTESQLAVLKANRLAQWSNPDARLSEGLMTGLFAGIIGLLIALAMIVFLQSVPTGELGFLVSCY